MTNKEIFEIALQQSAYDCNCNPEDFLSNENKIVLSHKNEKARAYMPLPLECDFVSYGNNIVAQVSPRMKETVEWFIGRFPVEHCFESPNVIALNEKLAQFGYKVCFMAEYFLPDVNELKELFCDYEIKVLHPKEFEQYYTAEWSNALCKSRKHLDKLAVGAFDNGKLIGLAGCSADCEAMYQIGVDVLPEYRRKGIASAITSRLAMETLKLGKVPFYCAAWSNIRSVRNAIKCGFRPAWVELTARESEFVDEINGMNTDFCLSYLIKSEFIQYSKALFEILSCNMEKIAPTGNSKDEDYRCWSEAVSEGLSRDERQIILIKDKNELIGFFQYYIRDNTFMMEEIQIKPDYHGKNTFRSLYGFLLANLGKDIEFVEAYANKKNERSIGILGHLGLSVIGTNKNGNSYHFKGKYSDLVGWFNSK
ncbi:MAG: GNAT family N-acetyltransferase [Ruminococcaceae bacterium]|nr:GNAT family N-acetyltransferase [Oscillospiraceae bacterium]